MKQFLLIFIIIVSLLLTEQYSLAALQMQPSVNTATTTTTKFLQKAPFTTQAPFGEWSDLRQEDGCEEASSLMAIHWTQGKTITKEQALKDILGSSDFTQKKYGEYRDISVKDTFHWIVQDYFKYRKVALLRSVSKKQIIKEIQKGNVVIAPMNGQKLKNPNFVAPGPMHHMLLIIGYDAIKKVFVTNDPGTRKGDKYQYDEDLLFAAIRDYPTGNHLNTKGIEKNIITVWK